MVVGKSGTGDIEAETWTRRRHYDGGIKMDKRLGVEVEDASMKEWGRV